jgi:hypothetical protein
MRRRTGMRQLTMFGVVCLAAFSLAPVARAGDDKCKDVSGRDVGTAVPAPNEPFGLSVGSSTGSLKGARSGYLTSLTPQPDGSIRVTSVEVFVLGLQDILVFTCLTTGTPVPGAPVGTVSFSSTYTVAGGTGEFAGASGTLHGTGMVFNAFGPNAGPGSTYSESTYTGNICRSK